VRNDAEKEKKRPTCTVL